MWVTLKRAVSFSVIDFSTGPTEELRKRTALKVREMRKRVDCIADWKRNIHRLELRLISLSDLLNCQRPHVRNMKTSKYHAQAHVV